MMRAVAAATLRSRDALDSITVVRGLRVAYFFETFRPETEERALPFRFAVRFFAFAIRCLLFVELRTVAILLFFLFFR